MKSTAGPTWSGSTSFVFSLVQKAWVNGFILMNLEYHRSMRNLLWLALWSCLIVTTSSAATIEYQLSVLPTPGQYRYTYTIEGTFSQNQVIDIQFDPTLYGSLFNGQAGSDWNLLVFQPNIPLGAYGDYSILALINNPSVAGTFSVDFTYLGTGDLGGPQMFTVDQYDANGNYISNVTTSSTIVAYDSVPEPTGVAFSSIGLLVICAYWRARSRKRETVR